MLARAVLPLVHAVLALARALALAPACAQECEALAGTDRQTCLLTCEQHERPSDSGVTTVHREERLGGAPPGSAHAGESGTTTIEQTTDARGNVTTREQVRHGDGTTTTSVITGADAGPPAATTSAPRAAATISTAPAAPRGRDDWFGIARCQRACDPRAVDRERATCKLGCLRLSSSWSGSRAAKAFDARR